MTIVSDRPAVLPPRPIEELVDVSEPTDGASGGGCRPAWTCRVERCACGGQIFAPVMDGFIAAAVLMHGRTPLHQVWRARRGL